MKQMFVVNSGNQVTCARLQVHERHRTHRFGDINGQSNRHFRPDVAARDAWKTFEGWSPRRWEALAKLILARSAGSNSKPSAKVEIHVATDASDSRSEANRKWRSLPRGHQCFGDGPQVSLPGLPNPPTPIAPPSNPLRMSSFLSPKFGAQPTHSPGNCRDFSNSL